MVISFMAFLGLFALIGISSVFASKDTKQDYYIASQTTAPALVGLSAVATNNSGYMFIGVIGYTYVTGLASIWLMIGWIAGDYLASLFIHKKLRHSAEQSGEVSFGGVLSQWHGQKNDVLQKLIGLVSLVFLMAYTSAQLVAGGKALHVLLDWPIWAGAVICSILVMMYCFAGGIRASIWTDVAQSIVMIVAMALLLVFGVMALGGVESTVIQLHQVDGFMNWVPSDLAIPGIAGGILFIVGWLFAGMSVIGQPHIMVRFMALNQLDNMRQARAWYYSWFILFYVMATGVGMLSRLYLADPGAFDAELALPMMAQDLFHPVLIGLVLAGIFAATMSTADSLVLSCSAAVTHDLLPHRIEKTILLKLVTIIITVLALGWALMNKQSVFNLVIMSWSGLASAFAPLLIFLSLGQQSSQKIYISAALTGLAVALVWRYLDWHQIVYEGMPGILSGLVVLYGQNIYALIRGKRYKVLAQENLSG